jgi:hypothetical protein
MGVAVRIAAVFVALAFAGCGNGDDDTEPGDIGHSYPASAHKEVLCKASVAAVRCLATDPKWAPPPFAPKCHGEEKPAIEIISREGGAHFVCWVGPPENVSLGVLKGRGVAFETKSVSCQTVRGGFDCQKQGSPDAAFELTAQDFSLNGQQ